MNNIEEYIRKRMEKIRPALISVKKKNDICEINPSLKNFSELREAIEIVSTEIVELNKDVFDEWYKHHREECTEEESFDLLMRMFNKFCEDCN